MSDRDVTTGLEVRIKKLREWGDVSARETDRLAGLHEGHTSLLECGQMPRVAARTVASIADVFGVSMDWLWSGKSPAPTAEGVRRAVAGSRRAHERTG